MGNVDSYLSGLVTRLSNRKDGKTKVKLRTLLGKFGYRKRGEVAVARIHQALRAAGLEAEFGIGYPQSLDEYVVVRELREDSGIENSPDVEASPVPAQARSDVPVARREEPPPLPVAPNDVIVAELGNPDAAKHVPLDVPDRHGKRSQQPRRFAEFGERLLRMAVKWVTGLPKTPKDPPPPVKSEPPSNLARPVGPDLRSIAKRAIAATVVVEADDGIGTGFFVHASGLLVTARHVVQQQGVSQRVVTLRFQDEREVKAVIFRSHPRLDYALAWAAGDQPVPTLPLGHPQRLGHADTVLAVGHPSSLRFTVSRGVVSNPACRILGIEYIQTDTAIDPGNSGGPLIDERGRVVGINVWGFMNLGAGRFALPIDYLVDDLRRALAAGRHACLTARYCRLCGFVNLHANRWYCENCGTQSPEYLGIQKKP